ncbi:MAG: ATP-binding protein [Desulfuromonadaceae bacterium]|nr:ATP-binding protein [Desulfuromonadaceae bacterium]MDD5106977.1 ATP-binding protein [Desulfuromonadaceae bacterium]
MSSTTAAENHPEHGKPLLALFGLIVAGLAGNWFNFEIFLNIDFLFGGIFAMLSLQFFGLGRGVSAATVIAASTWVLWNHPYAIVIQTAEVALVGLLMQRRRIGMVLADTIYWLLIGLPLIYLFYHLVMNMPNSTTGIIMIKQAINGIVNALVARLIFTVVVLRMRFSEISYSELIYNMLAFFVLTPALALLAVSARGDFAKVDEQIRAMLIQESALHVQRLETWVDNRKYVVVSLAEMAATRSPQQMQPLLELAKISDLNANRVGLMNREAITTAYFPRVDNRGESAIGKDFSDRPYISVLKQTLKPMLSELIISKIGNPEPKVSMLAPVVVRGQYGGYVIINLNLTQIREYLEKSSEGNGTLFTLLDKNDNIIITNHPRQTVMTPLTHDKGTLRRRDAAVTEWIPELPPNTPRAERWRKSHYITETAVGDLAEWKLVLEQPVAPFQKILYDNYTGKMALLFMTLLISLVLAELLSRRITALLGHLTSVTQHLPYKLAKNQAVIEWPTSAITEVRTLTENYQELCHAIQKYVSDIIALNLELEQRVAERTVALQKSEERLKTALEGSNVGVWDWNVTTNEVYFSRQCTAMLGYEEDEVDNTLTAWISLVHPEDREHFYVDIDKHNRGETERLINEHRSRCKDGSYKWVLERGKAVEWGDDRQPLRVTGTIADITTRKLAEEELKKATELSEAASQAKSRFLSIVAHEFNTPLGLLTMSAGILDTYRDRLSDTELREQYEQIRNAARQLSTLVGTISDVSRQERGAYTVAPVQMDIKRFCDTIARDVRTVWSRDHEFLVAISSECGTGMLDGSLLRRLLENLLTNAFRFTPAGGWVSFSVNREAERLLIEIADSGIGIPEEDLDKIFEAFYRGGNVDARSGLGLGLSIAREAITQLNGSISVVSRAGEGTTFHLELLVCNE